MPRRHKSPAVEKADVIVVGGGIAGGSLAAVMARRGAKVIVLERQTKFRDHVRGELLWPWGVKLAQDLGLYSTFLDAGARVVRTLIVYDEGSDRPQADDAGIVVPGVDGSVNLAHPVACAALLAAADSAGADVHMGVRDVRLRLEPKPVVRWLDAKGREHGATPSVVVGADGRQSSIRAQASIPVEVDPPAHHIAGMLVEGVESDVNLAVREADVLFLAFPQNEGRTRLYFNYPTDQRGRFLGRDATARFLAATRLESLNGAGGWHEASPAGPCATFPGTDSRASSPHAGGVVLIGDAAGYENPLRGQGLSMALQDVSDVSHALLDAPSTGHALGAYATARATRQRLANLATTVTVWANDGFRAQDPAQRASRYEHVGHDDVLASLSRTLWEGFDAVSPTLTSTDVAGRLESHR